METIRVLEEKDESRWDSFVMESSSATFFHQIGWKKVVENTYGHDPIYLFAEDPSGRIKGILPLFLIKSLLFGKQLVSIPYSPYGGCASDDQDTKDGLFARASELARELNVRFVELRNTQALPDIPTNNHYVTMLLRLDQGEAKVWSNLRKGMKACVKKAMKDDLEVVLDSKDVAGFYSVYSRRMHELGTPVPSLSFFENVVKQFPQTSVSTVRYKGEILATQFLLFFKKTAIYSWGASSKHHSETHPVHLLLWRVMQDSIARGYEIFDLGRSAQDTGTYEFKKWWGAEPQPLFYQYYLNTTLSVPYIHPSNPRYKLAIGVWRRLPLRVANSLGPVMCKGLV